MACDTVTWPQTDHKAQPQSDRSPMLWLTASATAASSVDRFNKDSTVRADIFLRSIVVHSNYYYVRGVLSLYSWCCLLQINSDVLCYLSAQHTGFLTNRLKLLNSVNIAIDPGFKCTAIVTTSTSYCADLWLVTLYLFRQSTANKHSIVEIEHRSFLVCRLASLYGLL